MEIGGNRGEMSISDDDWTLAEVATADGRWLLEIDTKLSAS